ncbi:hypothetical protein [Pseudomonas huanghezhanensis]|uniref:hypothetical protein n=1 Tax=Pseudomonas huanghezhanensis TaxID=3002903 RepID=UPI002285C967|nr:hypothetical protein [Pseudomonas sp. BSw22131]
MSILSIPRAKACPAHVTELSGSILVIRADRVVRDNAQANHPTSEPGYPEA